MLNRDAVLNAYFDRIHYTGPRTVSVATFIAIHAAHMSTIPLENLAIHEKANRKKRQEFISLDINDIVKKIVFGNRGGHCLEVNELLAYVLNEMGFKVDRLMARAIHIPGLSRGHKMLLVEIDEKKWIADVGFGSHGFAEPLPLILDQEFLQHGNKYRINFDDTKYIISSYLKNEWKKYVEFDLTIFQPIDYHHFNYSISHQPGTFFHQNKLCTIIKDNRRIVLFNNNLKIITNGIEESFTLTSKQEYQHVLQKHFGLSVPDLEFHSLKESKKFNLFNSLKTIIQKIDCKNTI